jgi:hypothetical protein
VKHLEEIREDGQVSVEVLDEDKGPKKYVFRGIVSRADVRNGNNRVYPRSVLAKAIGKLSEKLDGRTFGEADHPTDRPSVMRVAGIHRKVWMEADGTVWGESIIPETAMGRDLIAIANAGGRIGISTRGRGSVRTETWNDGKPADVIEDDYEMATWDFVVNQSEQSAEVVDVLRENRESQDSGGNTGSEETKESTMKTVDEFREKHPDLYQAVREECLDSLKGEFEAEVAEQIKAAEERLQTEMNEEAEVALKNTIAESMAIPMACLHAIAGLLAEAGVDMPTETVVEGSDEAQEAFEAQKQEIANLKAALMETVETFQAERTENLQSLIEAEVEKQLAEAPHASVIRKSIDVTKIESVEAVADVIEAEKAKIAEIIESTSVNKPAPKTVVTETGPSANSDEDARKAALRRLAGIK